MNAQDMYPEITAKLARERRERISAQRDLFRGRFAEWLRLRAEDHDPKRDGDGDDVSMRRQDRMDELARLITTTPAVQPWMIWSKLEVLEHALAGEDGTAWDDNREVVMLAGIRADLQAFNPAGAGDE